MRRLRRAVLLVVLLIGAFVLGVTAERLDVEPATTTRAILAAMSTTVAVLRHAVGLAPVASVGNRPVTDKIGATIFDQAAMAPGLTLLATGPDIALLGADGRPVYRWRVPLDKVFTLPALLDPADVETSGLQLLPDGSVLALVQYERDFPVFHWDDTVMNTALVKLDRDSKLVWSYLGNPHHDTKLGPDGSIYVLVAHEGAVPPRPDLDLPAHFRDEGIAILDAEGHEQRILWLAAAIANSPYANLFAALDPGWDGCESDRAYCWNLFHANSIQVIPAEIAARTSFAKPGDLLINLRELDAVLVLDPKTGALRWAMRGAWRHAHDAELTEQGAVALFDNRGNYGPGGGQSRIAEFDPANGALLWSYTGAPDHPFASSVHGTKAFLANGNVLVTETMGGRVFEATHDGRPVWEYVTAPVKGSTVAPEVWGAQRLDPAAYPFLAACTAPPCGVH